MQSLGDLDLLVLLSSAAFAASSKSRSGTGAGGEPVLLAASDGPTARIEARTYLPEGFAREVSRMVLSSEGTVRQWFDASGRLLARSEEGAGTTFWTYDQSGYRYSEIFLPENSNVSWLERPITPWERGTSALIDEPTPGRKELAPMAAGTTGGRLSDAINSTAAIHFEYSPDGKVLLERIAVDGVSFEVRHDASAQSSGLYRLSDSQGAAFEERRDPAGRLLSYSQNGSSIFERSYDPAGHVLAVRLGKEAQVQYEGDPNQLWVAKNFIRPPVRLKSDDWRLSATLGEA